MIQVPTMLLLSNIFHVDYRSIDHQNKRKNVYVYRHEARKKGKNHYFSIPHNTVLNKEIIFCSLVYLSIADPIPTRLVQKRALMKQRHQIMIT